MLIYLILHALSALCQVAPYTFSDPQTYSLLSIANHCAGFTPGSSNITTSMMAWWKLDEATGTTALDSSGNNQTGYFNGSPQWQNGSGVQCTPYGSPSIAFPLDGDFLSVTSSLLQNMFSPYTVSFWYCETNLAELGRQELFFGQVNGPNEVCWDVAFTPGLGVQFFWGQFNESNSGYVSLTPNVWTWIVWTSTVNGSPYTVYQNAIQTRSASIGDNPIAGAYPFHIGSGGSGANFGHVAGYMADVRIYTNFIMSAAQISYMYHTYFGQP